MTDFGTLTISEVILHRVPRGRRVEGAPDEIEYSEAPIQLGILDRDFITIRLRETLGGRSRPVVEDPDADAETPETIRRLFAGTGNLVADSAALARRLHAKQKWMSSVGLVMVLRGELDHEPCLVIAKMEHEHGMRVQPTVVDGKRTYKAEYLKDLILGQGTKVFKVGVFKASGAQPDSKLNGEVVDMQQGATQVAEYFVEFLGCAFVQRSDVQTQNFYKATQSFIQQATRDDPETNAEYEIALLSELQNQSTNITPEQFAQRHIKPEHRDSYIAKMEGAGVPVKGFNKNTDLISGNIRRVKVSTGRGATVLVPPPMYEDGTFSVQRSEGGETSDILVRDKILHMGGASGPKPAEDPDS